MTRTKHEAPHYAILHQFSATLPLSGSNIFLSTPFSNTLSVCSSLSMRDQVSHPHNTAAKIPFLFILIFRQNILESAVARFPEIEVSPKSFIFVIPIYLLRLQMFGFPTVSKDMLPSWTLSFSAEFCSWDVHMCLAFIALLSRTTSLLVPSVGSVFFIILVMLTSSSSKFYLIIFDHKLTCASYITGILLITYSNKVGEQK